MLLFFNKITRIFALQWGDILQYRMDLILWTLVGIITPLISMAIWYTVSVNSEGGVPPQEVITYYILISIVSTATLAWHGFFVIDDILKGNIVKDLIRPISFIWKRIGRNVVEKTIKLPVLLAALLIAQLAFPTLLPLIRSQIQEIPLFFVSITLALVISFSLETCLGMLAFWLEDAMEIIRFKFLFETVASGILIPYAFMPSVINTVLSYLPFRYMFAAPVEILLGQIQGSAVTTTLLTQSMWSAALIIIAVLLWKRGLRRYAVPGQ